MTGLLRTGIGESICYMICLLNLKTNDLYVYVYLLPRKMSDGIKDQIHFQIYLSCFLYVTQPTLQGFTFLYTKSYFLHRYFVLLYNIYMYVQVSVHCKKDHQRYKAFNCVLQKTHQ